jgi:hypothetical protein
MSDPSPWPAFFPAPHLFRQVSQGAGVSLGRRAAPGPAGEASVGTFGADRSYCGNVHAAPRGKGGRHAPGITGRAEAAAEQTLSGRPHDPGRGDHAAVDAPLRLGGRSRGSDFVCGVFSDERPVALIRPEGGHLRADNRHQAAETAGAYGHGNPGHFLRQEG